MPINNQSSTTYHVDIVMCIDATYSMSPIIDKVKANALDFPQTFLMKMDNEGKHADQVRIKVIVFRDYGVDEEPMTESRFFNCPEESAEFENFVRGIEPSGGGDIPENALEAIVRAMRSDWVVSGSKRRHVIVVFTDAPALQLGERASSPNYPTDMPADLPEFASWWEGHASQEVGLSLQPKAGRLVVFGPDAYPWTDLDSALTRYYRLPVTADAGGEDLEMESVHQLLIHSIN